MITSTCGIGFGKSKVQPNPACFGWHEYDLFGLGYPTLYDQIKQISIGATRKVQCPLDLAELGFTVVVTLSSTATWGENREGRVDERGELDFPSEPSSDLNRPLMSEMRRENGHSTCLYHSTAWHGVPLNMSLECSGWHAKHKSKGICRVMVML